MKITIEPTGIFTEVYGLPCRIWLGVTESGIPCEVLVPTIRVKRSANATQFDAELRSMPAPVRMVDIREEF